jgi:hypothetical protein
LYNLENLSISGCTQLTRIHRAAFASNLALKRVDLSANGLESLDPATLRWELLEHLNLGANPWNCNCSLLAFLPGVMRRIKRSAALCAKPEQVAGVEIAEAVSFYYCDLHSNNYTIKAALSDTAQYFSSIILFGGSAFDARNAPAPIIRSN